MTALAISNIVLWVVVTCLVFVLLALTRQLGVLHARIAPAGALMINRGPAVGEPVAALDVVDLRGREFRIGAANADGKSTLIKALIYALGDYAGTAEPDLFMAREGAHPTGEFDLRSSAGRRQRVGPRPPTGGSDGEAAHRR